jgi:diguanylate cyclase (GGDEF)-like protein
MIVVGRPYGRRHPGAVVDSGSSRSSDRPEGSAHPAQMNDFLVQLIVVAVLANVVLLVAALIAPRLRRPSRPLATTSPGPSGAYIAPTIAAPNPPASEAEGDSSTDMRSDTEETQRKFRLPEEDEYPSADSIEAFLAGPRRTDSEAVLDEQTGLETGFGWEVAVDREEKRVARYGKSVTVVVAELDRLDALAARLGPENADRLIPPVAATLRRLARAADLVARTGHSRFQILMPETDEIQAINYVERIRDACDLWLDAAAVSVRLVVGWASAGSGVTIRDASRLAEQRMHADRVRRPYGQGRAVPGSRPSESMPADTGPSRPTVQPGAGPEHPASAGTSEPVGDTAPGQGSSGAGPA